MAPPANAVRLSVIGTSPGAEIFDFSWWYLAAAAPSQSALTELCVAVSNSFTSADLTAAFNTLSTDQHITEVRAYGYAGGSTKAANVGTSGTLAIAGTGAGTGPLQQACACTIETGLPGRSYRGRTYLPASGIAVLAGHTFNPSALSGIVTAWAGIMNAGTAVFGDWPGGQVVVVSSVLSTATPATLLSADNRPDVQRRRANRQHATAANTAGLNT